MNKKNAGFLYLWEYTVKPEYLDPFLTAYGRTGKWAQLFSQSDNYLGTDLHQDTDNPHRFITIDHWRSRDTRDQFLIQFAPEFEALDKACEPYTVEERFLGDFQPAGN